LRRSQEDQTFEFYRLAVEMADRISARRGVANAFFLTADSALITAGGLILGAHLPVGRLGGSAMFVVGFLVNLVWWLQLASYKQLSAAKWSVISRLEEKLPEQPFTLEWKYLKGYSPARTKTKYREIGQAEVFVPAIFMPVCLLVAALNLFV
jgi:hypothetical protein